MFKKFRTGKFLISFGIPRFYIISSNLQIEIFLSGPTSVRTQIEDAANLYVLYEMSNSERLDGQIYPMAALNRSN